MEGIRALDLALEVFKELGYPMNDFVDNHREDIENIRTIYKMGYNNGSE